LEDGLVRIMGITHVDRAVDVPAMKIGRRMFAA